MRTGEGTRIEVVGSTVRNVSLGLSLSHSVGNSSLDRLVVSGCAVGVRLGPGSAPRISRSTFLGERERERDVGREREREREAVAVAGGRPRGIGVEITPNSTLNEAALLDNEFCSLAVGISRHGEREREREREREGGGKRVAGRGRERERERERG